MNSWELSNALELLLDQLIDLSLDVRVCLAPLRCSRVRILCVFFGVWAVLALRWLIEFFSFLRWLFSRAVLIGEQALFDNLVGYEFVRGEFFRWAFILVLPTSIVGRACVGSRCGICWSLLNFAAGS